jgi:catalase
VSGPEKRNASKTDLKQEDLNRDIETGANEFMTMDQGMKINDDQNSLKSGERVIRYSST